jgi:colicin import membrane protein
MSAALHGAVIALLLFFTYVVSTNVTPTPKVFELVAGEGDNYMAREAPALGSSSGVKVDIPPAPEPKPVPPRPVPQEVAPEIPATPPPTPKVVTPTPPKTAEKTVPDFKKKLQREVIVAESKAKREIKKEREKEAKRLADDQKTKLTKEEFDRANKAKTAAPPTKVASNKAPKVDAEGIAKGVVGGSTANKVGGAGGKALKTDNDDVLAAYDALFKQRLRAEFEPPPGLSDSLLVTVEVRSNVDGSLTGARVVKGSGSSEFDRSVLDAIRRVRMPARPDRKSETIEFIFTMRERTER